MEDGQVYGGTDSSMGVGLRKTDISMRVGSMGTRQVHKGHTALWRTDRSVGGPYSRHLLVALFHTNVTVMDNQVDIVRRGDISLHQT